MSERVAFTAPANNSYDREQKVTDKIAVIDADKYKYLITHKMFAKINFDGLMHDEKLLHDTIEEYLRFDIFDRFKAKAYVFCFSAPSKNVYKSVIAQDKKYKGTRGSSTDIYDYPGKFEDMGKIFTYINDRYPTLIFDDLEADDILSMVQCDDTFLVAVDKDLKQVPGFHWDYKKHDWIYINEDTAFRNLMTQILEGDKTDNFIGLRGFGEKSLLKFIEEVGPDVNPELLLHKVIKLFIDAHGLMEGLDTFVEMFTLAFMKMNRGDYFKQKYIKAFELIKALNDIENRETRNAQ